VGVVLIPLVVRVEKGRRIRDVNRVTKKLCKVDIGVVTIAACYCRSKKPR